ncbi:hypothetical protein JYK02_27245 [Corallococcus macrosporus]|uniref:SH3 domain-containing protein n=1 Tax=Corallococcus macrosporus TaxID=35 RepID=A0ABS3DIT8_9BACT|nr:hypothetical protein [Corallococcus macrosporus]MBN8231220.1 hypothetical protein [Corallococcus macrosporus]
MAGFKNGIICRWSVALRAKPHKNPTHPYQGVLADLPRGTPVQVTGQQQGWLAVTTTLQGKALHGYVSQETVAHSTPHDSKPHYELVPHGNVLIVKEVPAAQRQNARNVLAETQLRECLKRHSVPTVPASAMAGYLNSLHHLPAFDRHAPSSVSKTPGASVPSQNKWRGSLGEVSAQYKGLFPQRNLNILHANHPVFDLKGQFGGLNSVKSSVRSSASGGDPHATYLEGMADILGARAGKFTKASGLLYPQLPAATGTELMLRDGYLSINANHVASFRAALKDPANYSKKAYWRLADQLLNARPVRIHGTTYRSYQALKSLQQAPGTTLRVHRQVEEALLDVRQQLAGRVRSNGINGQHLVRLLDFRRQVGLANLQMSSAQLRTWLFPELLMTQRYGGGLRGNLASAGISGGRGSIGGAFVSMAFEGGGMLLNPLPPDAGVRLGKVGLAGGTSGLAGGFTESLVAGNAGSALARQLTSRGASSWMASGLGRGVGGAAGGGVAAPVFSMAMLALDAQEHSTTDYAAIGTRAAVSGGLSGALSMAAIGALAGSEVPLLGNAVGFIIGFAGYYIVDALVGDEVEQGVRRSMGR